MSDGVLPIAPAEELGLDGARVEALICAAEEYVRKGEVPSLQLALAYNGKLAAFRTFGLQQSGNSVVEATNETLYHGFSTTKAVVSSALWLLLQEEKVALDGRVVDVIPEFATNGKESVRVEHLLTHTAGFPDAPFAPSDWDDEEKRFGRFRQWRLDWEPGSRFVYHATSSMWVVAEIIERRAGMHYREFIRSRIVAPLGLEHLHVGLPTALNARVADVVLVGKPPRAAKPGARRIELPPEIADAETMLDRYNQPDFRAVGAPGGGGIMTAAALTMYYQALLAAGRAAPGARVWRRDLIDQALTIRTADLVDPMTGKQANRALGVVIAGDDDRIYRSFGSTNSPLAFGHAGLAGQVAWADPRSGISFVVLTNGYDRNPLRSGARSVLLSTQAASCAAAASLDGTSVDGD
jgi:CubicO group peptidase (beta-lactamase class C family)